MMRRDLLLGSGLLGGGLLMAAPPAARADTPQGPVRVSSVRTHDGETLFVKDWGRGRPLIFVAGLGLPSDMWDYQTLTLRNQGFRCIAYDRRGHGRSTVPGDGYDVDSLADDLAAVIAATGVSDAILIGHSIGCAEIVRYMTRYKGAHVAKLVLIATAATPFAIQRDGYDDGPTPDQQRYFLDEIIARDYPAWVKENQAPFFMPDTPALTQDWLVQMLLRTPLMAIYECTRHAGIVDFRPELPAIAAPTLLLHGDKDASTPVLRSQRTAALMSDARVVVYEGAPHGLFVTHAARINGDIAAFAR